MNSIIDEYREHSRRWAEQRDPATAEAYADWYIEHFPGGDASHSVVYPIFLSEDWGARA